MADWLEKQGWNSSMCSGAGVMEEVKEQVGHAAKILTPDNHQRHHHHHHQRHHHHHHLHHNNHRYHNHHHHNRQIEARAQSIVATIRIYESVLVNVPSVIYCIFAGTFFPTSLFGPSHTFRSLERHKWPQASHYSAHDRTDPGCRRFDLCSFLSKPASRVSSVVVSCGEQSHWLCQGLV